MLRSGDRLDVMVEKPAAGGRMIARHEGQVLLVSGAIPGERVAVRIERVDRRLAFAATIDVLTPSPDRRLPASDPACGGCLFSHIEIARQRELKSGIIADAFARIGKHALSESPTVAPSSAQGYRMRARLHVRDGRIGFYREGTHDLCDAAATGQLHDATVPAVTRVVDGVRDMGHVPTSVEVAESIAADQRALLIATSGTRRVSGPGLEALLGDDVQSIVTLNAAGTRAAAGSGAIVESLATLTRGRLEGELRRHPESFFQGNRFLVDELVSAVVESVLPDGDVLDLYAGVGLFAVALDGGHDVVAVEGHPTSGADLEINARARGRRITAVVSSVEHYLTSGGSVPGTVIVDPPRTGLSRDALTALIARAPKRLVYVSCDPATLARDTRSLLDSGHQLLSVAGFDLFPNTPHVETLAVFGRAS